MRWSEPSLPEDGGIGTTPTIKNHSVTFYRGLLYCFGGYDGRRNNQTLLIYSLREGKWIAPTDPNLNNNSSRHNDPLGNSSHFGAQYNVPPGRNGHTATLATSRRSRSSVRARGNDNFNFINADDNMQQQQPDDADLQPAEYDGGGENMQGGDVMPNMPLNEENSMDTDDEEDAQIFIIGGWLGSG